MCVWVQFNVFQKRERKKLATDSRWIGMAAEFIPVFSPADTNSGGGKILEMHVRQLCNLEPLQTRKSWWRYTSEWDRKIRNFGINPRDENVGIALRDIAENADCVTEGNLRLRRTHCEVVSFPGPPQNRSLATAVINLSHLPCLFSWAFSSFLLRTWPTAG